MENNNEISRKEGSISILAESMKKRTNTLLALVVSVSMFAAPLTQVPVYGQQAAGETVSDEITADETTQEEISVEETTVEEAFEEEIATEETDLEEPVSEEQEEIFIEAIDEETVEEAALMAAETEITELTASSLTAMFKAVSGSIEKRGSSTVLRFALNGTGYQDLFVGTYEEAVATTSGDTVDKSAWVHYSVNSAGKYEFVIPIEEGQTFIPIVALSASTAASGIYRWYPRQLTIDYEALTLVSDDYNHASALRLTNENGAFAAVSAALLTVGGPISNNYKETLKLTMGNADLDAAYIGTAAEAASASSIIAIDETNTFSIPVLANKMGGSIDYNYMDQDTVIAFRNAAAGTWTEQTINVSKSAGTATVKSYALEITKQPVNAKGFIGETISFTVKAKNAASYQWYYSKDKGKTWRISNASSAKTSKISVKVTSANVPYLYRCAVTGITGDKITSNSVKNIQTQLSVTAQAGAVADNKNVTFTAVSTIKDVTYQWYYSKDSGTTWRKSGAAGAATSAITFKASATNVAYVYRCEVILKNGISAVSNVVSIPVPAITVQPKSVSKGTKTYVAFSVTAINTENATYQWYYSKDGGTTWVKSNASGSTTAKISVSTKGSNTSNLYRCVITANWGYSVTSQSAGILA